MASCTYNNIEPNRDCYKNRGWRKSFRLMYKILQVFSSCEGVMQVVRLATQLEVESSSAKLGTPYQRM